MDNISSIAELLAVSWTTISRLLSFINIRQEGFAIIKKRWGRPVKVYDLKEHWCWKWPIAETFDEVDIRKQVIYSNAHSVKSNPNGVRQLVPSNTTIDAQCEFRIINPNIIYKVSDDIVRTENNFNTIESFVDNTMHQILSKMLAKGKKLDVLNIQDEVNQELDKYNEGRPRGFWKDFDFDVHNGVLIEKIAIIAFDNNISLRKTE